MNRSQRLMSLFKSLLETEKRLDQAITQKKIAVEEAHFKKIKKLSTVRINIFLERTSEDTLFILIGGKVRSDPSESEEEVAEIRSIGTITSKLYVKLNSEDAESKDIANSAISITKIIDEYSSRDTNKVEIPSKENNTFFEWHNRVPPSNISEFEIKTVAKTASGRIYISFISYTGVYEVCHELSQHIGIKRGSKSAILLGIWKYITSQKMRDPAIPKSIICNGVFKKVFNQDEITFSEIIQKLDHYLSPVEMISFDFPIPTQPGTKSQLAYDIKTELDPMNREYAYSNSNRINILNKKIEDILIRIEKQDEKVESLSQFIHSPKEYICNWILDSSKDLHLITDDLFDISDGFYTQKEIQESVYQLLQNYK